MKDGARVERRSGVPVQQLHHPGKRLRAVHHVDGRCRRSCNHHGEFWMVAAWSRNACMQRIPDVVQSGISSNRTRLPFANGREDRCPRWIVRAPTLLEF